MIAAGNFFVGICHLFSRSLTGKYQPRFSGLLVRGFFGRVTG